MLIFNPSDRHMWDTKDDQLIAEKKCDKTIHNICISIGFEY